MFFCAKVGQISHIDITYYLAFLYATCILIVLFLGINVLKKKTKNLSSLYFSFFALASVLWMCFLYLGGIYAPIGGIVTDVSKALFFFRFAFAAPAFMLPSLFLFFYYYPKEKRLSTWGKALVLFSALFILIISLSPLVHKGLIIKEGVYVADEFGVLFSLWLTLFQAYLLLIFTLAVYKTIMAHGLEKKKLLIAMIGFVFFEIASLLTNAIFPIFDIYVFQNESILFTLFFAIPAFYSMQKYRFFNLSIFSLNFLRKIVFFALVVFVGLTFSYLLQNVFEQAETVLYVFALIVGLYLYQKLESLFPEFIPQSLRKFQAIIMELRYKILFYDNYSSLITGLENDCVINLNITKVDLMLIRRKKTKINIPVYVRNCFIDYLEVNKIDILLIEEIPFLDIFPKDKAMLLQALTDLNVSVCIPLFSEKKIIGLFTLGHKENREAYIEEEIEMILGLKKNLEICFMNILLKKNLKKENNLMKATIEEKTRQIRKQYLKIKELLDQQSSFIAVTAHEFRTPLSIALFQLQEILDDEKIKIKDLKNVEQSLLRLKKLTQNLFDVQQYDLNKISLNLEKVNIVDFIKDAFQDCQSLTKSKKLKCVLENPIKRQIFCKIDRQQILQVFHNVLTNATKFTPEGGIIVIKLERNIDSILFKIIDSGIGVKDKNKKRIFQKFQTEKLSSYTGIGLGLYICKKILDLHGGKIWVEDAPQKQGAMFCILLNTL